MERETEQAAGSRQQAVDATANRVALLTPHGTAAIAVVRISGPQVARFLHKHFSAKVAENRCVHGILGDDDRIIDDPVIVLSGHGQIADINLHGGEWVVRECFELAERNGFAPAEQIPDATSDVLEQEMLDALPHARTELAIRTLLNQPALWSQFIKEHSESARPDLQVRVRAILDDRSLHWLLHPPKIAIVGVANVGKSTLANQLFGQQRSITADVPGTTRDWVGDWTSLGGLPILLLDTPGIRDSADAIEQTAIAQSRREIKQADLVILVIDPTQPREAQDSLQKGFASALLVVNKMDLPAKWNADDLHATRIVAVSGAGLDQLQAQIRSRFVSSPTDAHNPSCWTPRQQEILRRAMDDPQVLAEMRISPDAPVQR